MAWNGRSIATKRELAPGDLTEGKCCGSGLWLKRNSATQCSITRSFLLLLATLADFSLLLYTLADFPLLLYTLADFPLLLQNLADFSLLLLLQTLADYG